MGGAGGSPSAFGPSAVIGPMYRVTSAMASVKAKLTVPG
ncbi:hypothetical protein U716_07135 [Rhodobacter capsulatus B6]|nr:hypothetical protein U716_07135 [Rhodobacter capsulatus B6]